MSYYDNVKDAVNDENGSSDNKASFDTLKEEAQKTDVEEEEAQGDDTPIEVLEDGGLRKESSSETKEQKSSDNSVDKNSSSGSDRSHGTNQDFSALEQKLDRIIEQNQEMIEILRSFGS